MNYGRARLKTETLEKKEKMAKWQNTKEEI